MKYKSLNKQYQISAPFKKCILNYRHIYESRGTHTLYGIDNFDINVWDMGYGIWEWMLNEDEEKLVNGTLFPRGASLNQALW